MFRNAIKSLKVGKTKQKKKSGQKQKNSSLTFLLSFRSGEYVGVFLVYTALGERGDILSWGPHVSLCHRGSAHTGEQCPHSVMLKCDCHSPSANPRSPRGTCSQRNVTKAWK